MYSKGYYAMADGSLCQAADNTVTLSPYRWYMEIESLEDQPYNLPAEVSVKVIGSADEQPTDIQLIESAGSNGGSESTAKAYDLTGRPVQALSKSGIYIIGGKKVIIKK